MPQSARERRDVRVPAHADPTAGEVSGDLQPLEAEADLDPAAEVFEPALLDEDEQRLGDPVGPDEPVERDESDQQPAPCHQPMRFLTEASQHCRGEIA